MSIAAALGTMGLAIKSLDDEKRARAIQDEQLAGMREDRAIARRTNELNFAQLADKAAQEKTQRERLNAYNQLATTAKNDEDFLTQKIAKAKELGDGEGMLAARQQLATYKTQQLKTAVDGGLRRLLGTGDPTGLQDAYNNLFPDGNKVAVTRKPDGKYDLQFVDQSGKVVAQQPDMTVDSIGMMAMKLMDPKFTEDVWKQQLKDEHALKLEDKKGENKLKRDVYLEDIKSRLGIAQDERRADREAQNIRLRGGIDYSNTMARIGAEGAKQKEVETWKTGLKAWENQGAGPDTKETDKRVMNAEAMLRHSLGSDAMAGLNPDTQKIYDGAIAEIGKRIRSGEDPEAVVPSVKAQVQAKLKAKKTSGAQPTAAFPSFQ